ncbi:hypothetical protein [Actinokineospora bangkokensis]|uniref:HAF repeat-containing protein n=1 Tax=Actinokineospora bangkokensis TaxID=1193682 RepID=A0A1Q9LLB8_9PSEU|nr:hypothetical protein [Actinokineospora bangkokensis]OLR92826.1 hypothetical protein BJP25_19560 [Actinokineospora bangkokensis]
MPVAPALLAPAPPVLRALPTPLPGSTSAPLGITRSGLVVGHVRGPRARHPQAVVWRDGDPVVLGRGTPVGCNAHDEVIGTDAAVGAAVLWTGGRARPLVPPGAERSAGLGIADTGTAAVLGVRGGEQAVWTWRAGRWRCVGPGAHAVIGPRGDLAVRGPGGTRVHFGGWGPGLPVLAPRGGPPPEPVCVNAHGDVLFDLPDGHHHRAALWRGGRLTDLGTLGGRVTRTRTAGAGFGPHLNDAGEVAGTSTTADGLIHAFRWRAGDLVDLTPRNRTGSVAHSINARGDVAGVEVAAAAAGEDARLWPRHGDPVEYPSTGEHHYLAWVALAPTARWLVAADEGPGRGRRLVSSR